MKSITIHNLDDPLAALIRERAKAEGLSLNRTIKKLLSEALGRSPSDEEARKEGFRDLLGVWSRHDLDAFEQQVADLEKIEPDEWR